VKNESTHCCLCSSCAKLSHINFSTNFALASSSDVEDTAATANVNPFASGRNILYNKDKRYFHFDNAVFCYFMTIGQDLPTLEYKRCDIGAMLHLNCKTEVFFYL
jgi:hypothetical protein